MKRITNIMCGIILGVALTATVVSCNRNKNMTSSGVSNVTESTSTSTSTTSTTTEITTLNTTTSVDTSTTTESSLTTTVTTQTEDKGIVPVGKAGVKADTQTAPMVFNAETEQQNTTCETQEVDTIVTEATPIREYIVYKPSTHYVHKNTCYWVDSSCDEITSTSGLEARKCTECNPDITIEVAYEEPVAQVSSSMSYVKNFSLGTYYAYGGARYGGSGRNLIDCLYGDGTVKGSIASSYLYNNYEYNYNGKRTMVYLEVSGYPSMAGYYYLDDCDAGNPNVIDFFYYYNGNCQFQYQGVVSVDCYIVNY